MFQTLSTFDAASLLLSDPNAAWTLPGAIALVSHLESMEEDQIEFDRVAIRCDYNEFKSAVEAAEAFGYEPFAIDQTLTYANDKTQAAALRWLENRTTVVTFDGGLIVGSF